MLSSTMPLPADARGHTAPSIWRVSTVVTVLLLLLLVTACSLTSAAPTAATEKTARLETSALSQPSGRGLQDNAFTQASIAETLTTMNAGTKSDPPSGAPPSLKEMLNADPRKPLERVIVGPMPDSISGGVTLSHRSSSQVRLEPVTQAVAYKGRFMPKLRVLYTKPTALQSTGADSSHISGAAPWQNDGVAPPKETLQRSLVVPLHAPVAAVEDETELAPRTTSQRLGASAAADQTSVSSTGDGGIDPSALMYEENAPTHNTAKRDVSQVDPWNRYYKDVVIDTGSTDAFLPINIIGSGTTVVKFKGKVGNVINAVVQLKEHRYDKSVSKDNCHGMYLRVELNNRYLVNRRTWDLREHEAFDENSDDADSSENTESRSSLSFWDFFAPAFDNSALCEALQSVSLRVNKAPVTEEYFITIQSSLISPDEKNQYYANVSFFDGAGYTCAMNVYIAQEPAARQERMQLIFALILPLLVLFLPLFFTMRRADLLRQFLLDADFAEWMWLLPLLLSKKMLGGLRAGVDGVIRLRSAYEQRRLQTQLMHLQSVRPNTSAATAAVLLATEEQQQQSGTPPLGWGAVVPASPPSTRVPHPGGPPESADEDAQRPLLPPFRTLHEPSAQRQLRQEEASVEACENRGPDSMTARAQSGTGFGESHDRTHHHHICHHHTDGHYSDVTMAPPHLGCPRAILEEDGGSLLSMTGGTHGACRCCQDGREGRVASEASTAVLVHVPPLADATEHLQDNHRRGRRARNNGYDLLFTTEESVHGEQSPAALEQPQRTAGTQQQSSVNDTTQTAPKRPREEEEAILSGGGSVDCVAASENCGRLLPCNTTTPPVLAAATTTPEPGLATGVLKTSPNEEEEEEEPFCRICRDGDDVAPLITPCACTGSVRFVHATCLDRWRIESAKRNLTNVNQCEICKETFHVNIGRWTLLWESSRHALNGLCLFLACLTLVVAETTLTHTVIGEMSCSASYHRVSYGTMFRFEGLALTFLIYGLMVLLVLCANLIVYSWFCSRSDVEEYIAEMHILPPFYTRRNVILILVVCVVLLAQVHATGYLFKYFLYKTSHIVWNWETSPLMGGLLFSLFFAGIINVCSVARQMYMEHIVNRSRGVTSATDVVVQPVDDADHSAQGLDNSNDGPASEAPLPPSQVSSSDAPGRSPSAPPTLPTTCENTEQQPQQPEDEDLHYTRHFSVPPELRVIRAFEYCPPRRKPPKG
ncbi:hypothetical protein JKF63_03923 [Porcisia hertigi]|uniref:RING-CH-type domain-containing protein n=1 Tax=Porcisia hertigi TaxID=2761500 RepID=A0A836ICA3_9TRYP|nr:hypothetical protein JKF63_03923 [Porcisia hertigi]